jgi:hypothetical protein
MSHPFVAAPHTSAWNQQKHGWRFCKVKTDAQDNCDKSLLYMSFIPVF